MDSKASRGPRSALPKRCAGPDDAVCNHDDTGGSATLDGDRWAALRGSSDDHRQPGEQQQRSQWSSSKSYRMPGDLSADSVGSAVVEQKKRAYRPPQARDAEATATDVGRADADPNRRVYRPPQARETEVVGTHVVGRVGVEANRQLYRPPQLRDMELAPASISWPCAPPADVSEASVSGEGSIPEPWLMFQDCKFSHAVMAAILAQGFKAPTPIQACCWPLAFAKRDVVGVAQTGSGKTLAYVIPAFAQIANGQHAGPIRGLGPRMLVLAPTRELAVQIQTEADKFGDTLRVRSASLYGGAPRGPQLGALKGGVHLVVGTPGRLNDFLEGGQLSLSAVQFLVVDEADQMLDLGFEPQIRRIIDCMPSERQTLMYSATWPVAIQKLADDFLKCPVRVQVGFGAQVGNPNIKQEVRVCMSADDKSQALLDVLGGRQSDSERVMIFVNTKIMCSLVEEDLLRRHVDCVVIHGDKNQTEREAALAAFKACRPSVLVATDVAARGLDIKGVQIVISHDIALTIDTHVHRIGRTGRAGAVGTAVTLIVLSDRRECVMAKALAESMKAAGHSAPAALMAICSEHEEVQSHLVLSVLEETERLGGHGGGSTQKVSTSQASTVNTALTNPVLALFGHAKARAIASDDDIVRRTNTEGKRFLTQQSRETKRGEVSRNAEFQFGWIKYRHVSLDEIRQALLRYQVTEANISNVASLLESTSLVHTVVTNIHDESFIVTNYFANAQRADFKDLVRTTLFDFLDSDDPVVISDAMENPIFLEALRSEFTGGDQKDSRLWKSLSKIKAPLNILHHCCENNYHACVEMLLSAYAMQTAEEPCQVLAELDLWVDKFRNTAFHSAAYRGSAESLAHLVSFAHQHNIDVTGLRDKDGKSALDIAEGRGHHRCYNILASAFDIPQKGDFNEDANRLARCAVVCVDYSLDEASDSTNLTDTVDARAADLLANVDSHSQCLIADLLVGGSIKVPAGRVLIRVDMVGGGSLWDVYQPAESLTKRLSAMGNAVVQVRFALRRRCYLEQEGTAEDLLDATHRVLADIPTGATPKSFRLSDYRIVQSDIKDVFLDDVFKLLYRCTTISFHKCLCDSKVLLQICRAVRHGLEAGSTSWSQLYVFPSCQTSSGTLPEFETELPRLVRALRTSSVLHISRSGTKRCGISAGPIPAEAKYFVGVLSSCLDVKRFANSLKGRRQKEKLGDGERADGTAAVFMHGVLLIWRHCLDYARLLENNGRTVDAALDANTELYVVEWLNNMSDAFKNAETPSDLERCREQLGLDPEELGELLKNLDFAVWALLRMHRLLPYAPAAVAQQLPSEVLKRLTKTQGYRSKKGWDQLMPSP